MSNRLSHLLKHWQRAKTETDWVLGTVYRTEGSSYRKAGAMMLFNGRGEQFGLLSGGCLEADIQLSAKRVMQTGKALTLCYDGSDEDDISFQFGIGCGGTVYILLQPLRPDQDLGLEEIAGALQRREAGLYRQRIPSANGDVAAAFTPLAADAPMPGSTIGWLEEDTDGQWLITPIVPEPHLLIIGGGADARPVVALAKELGWQVTLCDPRPANARRAFFPDADTILRELNGALATYAADNRVDAAIVMAHSVPLDAAALKVLAPLGLKYLALLGPRHRYDRVLEEAGLSDADLSTPIAGPAGLDIGADFPEGIALAMLTECHAALKSRTARSLTGILAP